MDTNATTNETMLRKCVEDFQTATPSALHIRSIVAGMTLAGIELLDQCHWHRTPEELETLFNRSMDKILAGSGLSTETLKHWLACAFTQLALTDIHNEAGRRLADEALKKMASATANESSNETHDRN